MTEGYSLRRTGARRPSKVLVIVCEGKKTEPLYFQGFRVWRSGLAIWTPGSKSTDPVGLVKSAQTQIGRYDLDFEGGDRLWCVFDADHHTDKEIKKAAALAKRHDIGIALSVPCFELWYLLHHQYIDSPMSSDDVIRTLGRYIPAYQKTKECSASLRDKIDAAIRNAKRLNALHEKRGQDLLSVNCNPSTQVYRIVDYISSVQGRDGGVPP